MTLADDIKTAVVDFKAAASEGFSAVDLKLDEIKAFIQTLGGAVSADDAATILTMLGTAKTEIQTQSAAVLAEADALDDPPTP